MRLLTAPLLPLLLHSLTTQAYTPISNDFLKAIPPPAETDFNIDSGGLLAPLLIPRVPGTPGQVKAQRHFVDFFRENLPEWEISWQNSTGTTPSSDGKQLPFQNLIIRREPPWTKQRGPGTASFLTLVAHYDSKITPKGFIGATDSAAPCAILMYLARTVEKELAKMWARQQQQAAAASRERAGNEREEEKKMPGPDVGIQILLLDGEEAFVSWTDTDSLYGARSLAAEWENTTYPAMSPFKNPMRQISLFVLLDLLGAAGPTVPSYFQSTHWAYQRMAALEGRLRQMKILESKEGTQPFLHEGGKMAAEFSGHGFVGDDHVPFMARGADVLHIIPTPFPRVWHTAADDGKHLDMASVRDWARIVTAFTLEWMDVQKTGT